MKKLLALQHIEREHSSRIAEYANERGFDLDVIKLWEPYMLPPIASYDALIILGGPMGVYEEFPSKDDELALIKENIGNIPILGICLGAQLIAHALGARVYPLKKGGECIKEIGYYDIELTPEGAEHPLFKGFPPHFQVLQWHGDTFDLPPGASLLASAPLCTNQAFSRGNAYGLQFHIEITPELLRDIATEDSWARTGFDLDEENLLKNAKALEPVMKEQCYTLMDNFLS